MGNHTIKTYTYKIIQWFILIVLAFTTIYPFIWLFLNSFKEQFEIFSNPFGLPKKWLITNLIGAWDKANINVSLFNSIFICFTAVILILVISAPASYVIARRWVSDKVYAFFTLGIMVSVHAVLIPTFSMLKKAGLYDTHLGLILVYTASNLALAIFILVGFMKGLPVELEEAATIDGCGYLKTFLKVILPISKPGLATVGILTFLNCWNEYLFAFVLIGTPAKKTLTQTIMGLQGQYNSNYAMLCAGLFISILPVLIIYVVLQENVIKGLTAGAVKG